MRRFISALNTVTAILMVAGCTVPVIPTSSPLPPGKIVFASTQTNGTNIYSVNADGTGLTQLTNIEARNTDPVWSPNGTQIAFISEKNHETDLYVINGNGTGLLNLSNTPIASEYNPTWSPDGTQLAFISGHSQTYQIYTVKSDGSETIQLTKTFADYHSLSWSPDGEEIAFSSKLNTNNQIYLIKRDGSALRQLTSGVENYREAVWSPDGSRLAVTYTIPDFPLITGKIILVNKPGQAAFASFGPLDRRPSWSPDGAKLAFYYDTQDKNSDIFIANAEGANQIKLTTEATFDYEPVWSPDGRFIAFKSGPSEELVETVNLYLLQLSNSHKSLIADGVTANSGYDWYP